VNTAETSRRRAAASAVTPPKVLQVGKFYPPHYGGIETHLQVLCHHLHGKLDLQVVVANGDRTDRVEQVEGIEVSRVGTWFNLAGAPVCPGLVGEIRRSRADLVHLHLPHPVAVMAYLASGHRGRLVVSYHSDIVRQRLLYVGFEPVLSRLLDRCDAIIAATPNYVESSPVLARYRDRCRVIPYGIPLEAVQRNEEEVAEIRRRFGDRLVVSVGRLVYYKGFEYLVEAMRSVRGHLVIIGDGPLRRPLEERIRALGLQDRVTLIGRVDDLVSYYHAADVFALASVARSEAFGIVQLEAMACGKPVVNTALDSGVPYVSLHGETGLTVPPCDAGALAEAVNLLLDDPELRRRYGAAARKRVEEEFSEEVMGERTLALYREILGGSHPARARR
jgi:glycosyltransferase involved in cell wall biosynthesis